MSFGNECIYAGEGGCSVLPKKCKEHIDVLTDFLNDIGDFLKIMKCPYGKELYIRTTEIRDSLRKIQRCKKCDCETCECMLDEALEELINKQA